MGNLTQIVECFRRDLDVAEDFSQQTNVHGFAGVDWYGCFSPIGVLETNMASFLAYRGKALFLEYSDEVAAADWR